MQTAFEITAVLRLLDEASPVLRLLSEKMEAFDKLISTTQKSLSKLGQTKIGELGGSITSVQEKLKGLGSGAEGAANKINGSFQNIGTAAIEAGRKMSGFEGAVKAIGESTSGSFATVTANVTHADEVIGKATISASALTRELREAGAASRDIPRIPSLSDRVPGGSGGGGRGGHPRPGQGGGHDDDGHGRIRTKHGERPNETDPHGAFIDAGVLGTIGFHEFAHAVETMVEAGGKMEKYQAQLQAATGDMGKVAEATAAAWDETSRNLTTNVGENLRNIQHLMNVVGSLDEAKSMLHPFTMVDTALGSIKDDTIAGGKGSKALELNAYNVARSLEQLGVTQDEEKLQSYTDHITRMMIGMRGLVDGTKLFTTINNAGGARYAWDEDFVTYGLGPLAQATNGRAGAQLYQLNRSYYQGVSTKMMAEGAEKYGLWKEDDEVWQDGKFKGMKVGSIFHADTLMHNPVKWAGEVREMMQKRGVDVDDTDVMTKVIAEATRGNKNLGAIMDELILPKSYQALMKERKNIEAVPEDAVSILQKHDPGVAMKAFNEQFENLLTALGKPTIGQVADTLNKMAGAMNGLARWFDANPEYAKAFTGAMAGIAAGLAALAVVGLAAFAPGGIAVVALVTFAGAMSGVAAVNWDKIQQAAMSIGLSMDNFHKNIGEISGAFDQINTALTKFFTGLVNAVRSIPGIGRLFDESGPTANANGAPLTQEQKNWLNQHTGSSLKDMPAGLVPGPQPLSPAQANRFGHMDGIREGTDRDYHRVNGETQFEMMKQLGLVPSWATREPFGPNLPNVPDAGSQLRDLRPKGTEEFGPRLPVAPPQPVAPVVPPPWPVLPAAPKSLGMDPSDGPSGFIPMAYHPDAPANDNVRKALGGVVLSTSDHFDAAGMKLGNLVEHAGRTITNLDGLGTRAGQVTAGFDGLTGRSKSVQESFGGLNARSGDVSTGFGNIGTGSSGLKNAFDILTATAIGAARALAEIALAFGGGAGGLGGSGGLINASWGGGGQGDGLGGGFGGSAGGVSPGGLGGFGGSPNLAGGDARGEEADYIRAQAAKYGIDPRVAVAVARSEGLGVAWGAGMDHGTSFGAFQLHIGGGLGDIFQRETGLDPRNQANWRAMDDFALRYASKHGWGDWHGAARIGVHGMAGIGGVAAGGLGGANEGIAGAMRVANEQCVALANAAVGMSDTVGNWRKGESADLGTLVKGTPVATFLDRFGREVDRYADGTGGRPGKHLDHAGVFEHYLTDSTGKRIGMAILEQFKGSHGVHMRNYMFGQGWGEGNGSNYHAILGADGRYLGGARNPHNTPTVAGPPPKRSTPGVPAGAPGTVTTADARDNHHHIYLDGRKIAQVVTKHQSMAMRFPRDMGGPDTHGSFVSPGTPVTDAA